MRKRLGSIRRQELAEATFLTLKEFGFRATTVARVSSRAGLSRGLVHHYFETKSEMIEAAIRLASTRISQELVALLAEASTPRERLSAVIEANFAPGVYGKQITHAWMFFGAEAATNPQFSRILHVIYARMRANLRHCLRQLVPECDIDSVATGIAVMIDGAWMRCALNPEGFDRDQAVKQIHDYVAGRLPQGARAPLGDPAIWDARI
jgi:TetR/AcrR family transcriptional repressor of bet genes